MRCQIFRDARYATLARPMSALPPKADIGTQLHDVRYVPEADIRSHSLCVLQRSTAKTLGYKSPSVADWPSPRMEEDAQR